MQILQWIGAGMIGSAAYALSTAFTGIGGEPNVPVAFATLAIGTGLLFGAHWRSHKS